MFMAIKYTIIQEVNQLSSEGILQVGQTPLSHSELLVPEDVNTENCLIGFEAPHFGQLTPSLVALNLWSNSNFVSHFRHLYS